MKYLLDTNICIYITKHQPESVRQHFEKHLPNRNILISDIPTYVKVLNSGGKLLLSGLCFFDVDDILEVCKAENLTLEKQMQREEWVSLLLSKP